MERSTKLKGKNSNSKGDYSGYLSVAFLIAIPSAPFFARYGWLACLELMISGGFVFGTAFFLLSRIESLVHLSSFFLQILVKAMLHTAAIAAGASIMVALGIIFISGRPLADPDVWHAVTQTLNLRSMGFMIGLGLVLSTLISGSFAINKKLGPGVLLNWVTGKYYTPREEVLVFMFLDLNDSTTLAEKLGNIQFSALVREFFSDLTRPLTSTGARVSHYIGDEAVIYWFPKLAFKNSNCIQLFCQFDEAIQNRATEYQSRFGLVPNFKAGLHMGSVVATEVGDLKSEVVFHGDVLNTTARIQGLCSELSERFLLSGEIAAMLPEQRDYELVSMGSKTLKGKSVEVPIHAIHFPNEH